MSGPTPRTARRHTIALLTLVGVILAASAWATEVGYPIISSYSSSEVGVDPQSYAATQAESGSMIFGGNTLMCFDGERWTHTTVDGLYGLRSLSFNSDGRLWAAATGDFGWFERTPADEWKYRSLLSFLPDRKNAVGTVWRVFPEKPGALFVTGNRILRWDGSKLDVLSLPASHRLLGHRVNGTIYVQHLPQGLLALHPSGPQVFIPHEIIDDAAVMWMDARAKDWLLGTSKGLFLYQDQKLVRYSPPVSQVLASETLACGARLPDGRYAFGTMKGSVVVMGQDGSLEQFIDEKEGLSTSWITSLLVDRDGQLWATSPSGIFRIDLTSGTRVFDERSGLPTANYGGIAQIGDRIVVSSENGLHQLSADNRGFTWLEAPREKIHALRSVGGELLLSGVHWAKKGHDGDFNSVFEGAGDVFTVTPSRRWPNRFLVSNGLSIILAGPENSQNVLVHELSDFARSIAEDDAGALWLGTIVRGVLVAYPDGETAVEATRADGSFGLPVLNGRTVVRAGMDGSILVFAENGGWWKPTGDKRFRAIKNYPQRGIAAASEFGADGTGWVVHPESNVSAACAARITIAGSEARWEPHSIPGLPTIGSPRSVFVEATSHRDVKLWIGGTKSILRHVVREEPSAPRPRAPLLRSLVRSTEKNAPQPIAGALPYSTPSIEFEFSEPEFLRRASLRLETRIDGIDREWIAAPEARRTLTALRDGNYLFRVRAMAETGVASDETVFKFQVLPPWWRTTPVLAGAFFALLPLGYGAYRFRVRTLRRRNSQLEAKVRQRTKELEEASAAKTQFVANMSHDIRNPLNGIVGLALALENTKLDRRQREMVATLRECSTYLSTLVDDVLDFASIEAGRVELRPGPFVPQELLRSIVNTLKADANSRGALLLVEADPHLPPNILGDAGRIQQILVNFVSNALKYAGGQIRISVSTRADAMGEIEFAVTDEGPGISAEEQRTLFTKFTRLKRLPGEEISGSGLGLAACRLLADLMGGSVGVESRVGDGARFYLRLPLTIATAPAVPSTAKLPNTTVLVVEDTDYNAWAAEAVLAKLGLTCERARTGAEALEMFAAKRFNVVLLDRNLPDMDGTEVARQMREMETEGPQSVLLAVTAYCTAEDRALCLEAGMDAFVGKPLTPEKLRKVLLDVGRRTLTAASVHVSAEPPATPVASEIDVSMLKFLSDGSPESFDAQVQRFVAELVQAESQLRAALQDRDCDRVRRRAHGLLGPAKLVGAAALVEACTRLETAARSRDAAECEERFDLVVVELKAVRAAMHRHRPAEQSM